MSWLLNAINGYKTYAATILAVVTGLGMIVTKNYSGGLSTILQALMLLSGGAAVASMRQAVGKATLAPEAVSELSYAAAKVAAAASVTTRANAARTP